MPERTVQLDVTHSKAAAIIRRQAERIAELEKLVEDRRTETNRVIAIADSVTAAGREQGLREAQAQHIAAHGFDKHGFAAAIEQLRGK